jgi:hypothetical protein
MWGKAFPSLRSAQKIENVLPFATPSPGEHFTKVTPNPTLIYLIKSKQTMIRMILMSKMINQSETKGNQHESLPNQQSKIDIPQFFIIPQPLS